MPTDLTQERDELVRRFHELGHMADTVHDKRVGDQRFAEFAALTTAQAIVFNQLVTYEMATVGLKIAAGQRPKDDEWGT